MALNPGDRLGSYEILSPLGAGGMGEVYRALDTNLGRDVAVKVLPRGLAADPQSLARFEHEARAVASLSHSNILAIHDFGSQDGTAYAVTELLEGETLGERLKHGPLPLRQATGIGRDIAQGLAAAHERGIAHRDLKPDNVFLLNDGRVKILDFGLAKRTDVPANAALSQTAVLGGEPRTEPGTVLGTVGYMSPEQVRGDAVDHRTDFFSFGVVLYEMLSGARPFLGDTSVETMTAILREDPPDLSELVPALPPALDRVIRRCLEKRPEARFHSARDLAFALVNAGRTTSTSAAAVEAVPERGRNRRWLVPAGFLVLGTAIGLGLGWLRGPEIPTGSPKVRPITFSGRDWLPTASPDGKLVAFVSDRDGLSRIWIKQIASGGEAPLTEGPDTSPRFSPDGSQILFSRDEGESSAVYRQALVGGRARRLLPDAYEAAWSPDGRRIAFIRGSNRSNASIISVSDDQGDGARDLFEWGSIFAYGLVWSPDGREIGLTGTSLTGNFSRFRIVDAESGTFRDLQLTGNPLTAAAWSGSGELILGEAADALGALSDPAVHVVAIDPRSGKRRPLFWEQDLIPGAGGATGMLSILAPGTIVYDQRMLHAGLALHGVAPEDGREVSVLTRGRSIDRQPAFSPDGGTIVFSSNRAGQLDLWTLDVGTGKTLQLTDDPAVDWDPDFTPDGGHILWSSNRGGNLEIWMAQRDGSDARQVSQDGVDAENPTMTRDGEWIVYSSSNPEKVGIWRVRPDGSEAAQISSGSINLPEVSPDGRYALASRLNRQGLRRVIEVIEIREGRTIPFKIEVPGDIGDNIVVYGRARWMPDGKAIAFVGMGEEKASGIFVQDFEPGRDTEAGRRRLAGFSPEFISESFDIRPDGGAVVISRADQVRSLMLVEGLPGVAPAPAPAGP